jgi:hypothetical protein
LALAAHRHPVHGLLPQQQQKEIPVIILFLGQLLQRAAGAVAAIQ